MTTISLGNKTKGYFVRSIPDANWYRILGLKSDFTKMSGRIFVYNIKGKLISNAKLVNGVVSNNLATNQNATNGNQLGVIKSNSWGYDENGLFSVTVYGYRRHTSWSDLISLAIFDSGNDLGIPLGGDYTPFVPFDPIYGAPGGGGGTINLPPVDPLDAIYNCNCNCAEEDDGTNDLSESFEPKWGQLGTLNNILTEVRKNISQIPNFQNINFENQLNGMRNYFEANRMFTRDNQNNFIDDFTNGSKKIDRYIYTFDLGWIDMHHFFYAAYLAEKYNVVASNSITSYAEILQQLKGNESAFSYEDLQSNSAGIDFYKKYASILRNKNISLETALDSYFTTVNATDPSNSPNYDYIPHIIDGFYAKNISIKGLIGSQLFEAAYEAYCKKPTSRKQSIKEAHIKIKHSSN